MKIRSWVFIALVSGGMAGCQGAPMTYVQWKKEQADRRAFEKAGLEYKSPDQLRAEAQEMSRLRDEMELDGRAR